MATSFVAQCLGEVKKYPRQYFQIDAFFVYIFHLVVRNNICHFHYTFSLPGCYFRPVSIYCLIHMAYTKMAGVQCILVKYGSFHNFAKMHMRIVVEGLLEAYW